VALYIHLLHWWSGFLLLGTMLYLPSMSINMQGSALNTTDLFLGIQTVHALGNADALTLAHGATELVVVSALVWFMFWQSAKTKHWSARITHHDLSAANYTVMVRLDPLPMNGRPPGGIIIPSECVKSLGTPSYLFGCLLAYWYVGTIGRQVFHPSLK
jgi:hypothetical protein